MIALDIVESSTILVGNAPFTPSESNSTILDVCGVDIFVRYTPPSQFLCSLVPEAIHG
jgi:hypothetical protein